MTMTITDLDFTKASVYDRETEKHIFILCNRVSIKSCVSVESCKLHDENNQRMTCGLFCTRFHYSMNYSGHSSLESVASRGAIGLGC